MELNVCLVCTKLHFVTILTNFCDAKMTVYDFFRFGPKKFPLLSQHTCEACGQPLLQRKTP